MISVHPLGQYLHRQPLAYEPVRALVTDQITLTQAPAEADILLLAHSKDLHSHAELLAGYPDKKIVLLSEEPFWDTIWAKDPFSREQQFTSEDGSFPFTFLNQYNSEIYAFEQIPYYLLTDHRFATRYALRFDKNRHKSAADWERHFERSHFQAAFIAEKRLNEKFSVQFALQDTYGLCRFRSQLTGAYDTGNVYRAGQGWRKALPRQELQDWHMEKLLLLDGKCRFVSALENTHQKNYVSEKLFDAFSVGAVPLFYGSSNHSIHRLVPAGSWLNLFGMSVEQAISAINTFSFDEVFLDHYRAAQQQLASIFCDPAALVHERHRLMHSLVSELQQCLCG